MNDEEYAAAVEDQFPADDSPGAGRPDQQPTAQPTVEQVAEVIIQKMMITPRPGSLNETLAWRAARDILALFYPRP